jgi:hypothetical protein
VEVRLDFRNEVLRTIRLRNEKQGQEEEAMRCQLLFC